MYEQLRAMLDKAEKVVFFGGAGVSTESGIPDFRSESGVFSAMQSYGIPPEELLSHDFFIRKPEIFFRYYRESLLFDAKPGPAHLALARLEEQGKLTAIITQNIDGLHQQAGSKTVYELHGSVDRNYCMDCGQKYPRAYLLDAANCKEDGLIPHCGCGGIVRPDVVLYGEMLDDNLLARSADAIGDADLLIVGGTSLVVYPAAGLLRYLGRGKLVLLNKSATPYDEQAVLCIHDAIGEVLSAVID